MQERVDIGYLYFFKFDFQLFLGFAEGFKEPLKIDESVTKGQYHLPLPRAFKPNDFQTNIIWCAGPPQAINISTNQST
jgi:hypothetical protein